MGQHSVDVHLELSQIRWTNKMDAKLELMDMGMDPSTK
jgi:hypothetical protein